MLKNKNKKIKNKKIPKILMRRVEIVRMLMRVRKWVGREKGYSLSATADGDTCGESYFPKLIPKYCIPVFLRTSTLLFAPSEPKSFK